MLKNCFVFVLLLAYCWPSLVSPTLAERGIFDTCQQLVVVVSPNEKRVKAKLYRFEKQGKRWKPVGEGHAVNLGRKGLAWGRGLQSQKPGLQKKEGDQKSPAGIFRFGEAFGYAPADSVALKIPYRPITATQICVEDPASRHYNQVVDAAEVTQDWEARESMLRKDGQYKWGIYVKQNLPPESDAGSCIFFHLWRKPGSGTLGCTAMAEAHLLDLMQWLDPKKEPLLMQMSEAAYKEYQRKFSLPELTGG